MTEPVTDQLLATFRDAWMRSMQSDPRTNDPELIADRAGLTAVLEAVQAGRVFVEREDLRLVLRQRLAHSHQLPGVRDRDLRACPECAARERLADTAFRNPPAAGA